MIVLNALYIGVASEVAARSDSPYAPPLAILVSGWIFSLWFFVELTMRMWSRGFRHFACRSIDKRWNCFDLLVVPLSFLENVIETVLVSVDLPSPLSNVAALRLLRVLRLMRSIRVFQ